MTLSVHCHNDLGLAVANSLAGDPGRRQQVECTINGIGERAGNASLEEIVMALQRARRPLRGRDRHRHRRRSPRRRVSSRERTGYAVQPNKAIVGANAFAHEAGIHQDGMLKDARTYQIIDPATSACAMTLPLGKHSGRHAFARACAEQGCRIEGDELDGRSADSRSAPTPAARVTLEESSRR